MLAITNTAAQTLNAGATMSLPVKLISSGTCECFRTNSNSIKMRERSYYEIGFTGNIGSPTEGGDAELTIYAGTIPLSETNMQVVSAAAGDLTNVSATTLYNNCCGDFSRVTVVNTGTTAINIAANPVLYVRPIN